MGLLDDAIKEHLDLKRRRGADPGEIARQETEALGPVRRGEVDLSVRPTPAVPAEPPDDPAEEPEIAAYPEADTEPASLAAEPSPGQTSLDTQSTQQFNAVEADAASGQRIGAGEVDPDLVAEEDADADVLEETPEFLEETPEHDRLWFEQKPPKDFDF
jgi:hypothetical protein